MCLVATLNFRGASRERLVDWRPARYAARSAEPLYHTAALLRRANGFDVDAPLGRRSSAGETTSAGNRSRASARHADAPTSGRLFLIRSPPSGMCPAPRSGTDRLSEADFMHAPTGGRNGPVGAHPGDDGALLERWRAQDGMTARTIHEMQTARIWVAIRDGAYTRSVTPAFLSPAAIPAASPHQSTSPEPLLKDPHSSTPVTPVPPTCPSCGSKATVTAATTPSEESYWRCTDCGDVWNVSRTQAGRHGAYPWR